MAITPSLVGLRRRPVEMRQQNDGTKNIRGNVDHDAIVERHVVPTLDKFQRYAYDY
jgi:hypothetical protein